MVAVTIIQQGFKENINRQHMHTISRVHFHGYSLKVTWNIGFVFFKPYLEGLVTRWLP